MSPRDHGHHETVGSNGLMRRDGLEPRITRRELIAGAAAAWLGSCVGRERAEIGATVPVAARSRVMPKSVPLIYDERGGLFVDVTLASGREARLILDTGASRSTLARRVVAELGLAVRAGDPVEGSAGVVEAEQALVGIDVPGLGRRDIDCVLYEFGSYDPACVGILGNDVLGERAFRIDYRKPSLVWDPEVPGNTIELELDHGIPRITITVAGTELDVRIDTGASLAPGPEIYVNLTRAQADLLGLAGKPEKVFSATGTGGASLELPVHRVHDVQIGTVVFSQAFAILQPRVGYFARTDAVGFLGNSVLDKLDPYLDYDARLFAATARA